MAEKKIVYCHIDTLFNQHDFIQALRHCSSILSIDIYVLANISMMELHKRVRETTPLNSKEQQKQQKEKKGLLLGEKIEQLEDEGITIKKVITYADMYYFNEHGEKKPLGSVYDELYKPHFERIKTGKFKAFQLKTLRVIPFDDKFFKDLSVFEKAFQIFIKSAKEVEPDKIFKKIAIKKPQVYDRMTREFIPDVILDKPLRDLSEKERTAKLDRYEIRRCNPIEELLPVDVRGMENRHESINGFVIEYFISCLACHEKVNIFYVSNDYNEIEVNRHAISLSSYKHNINDYMLYIENSHDKKTKDYFYFLMKDTLNSQWENRGTLENEVEESITFFKLEARNNIAKFNSIVEKTQMLLNDFNRVYLSEEDKINLKKMLYAMAEKGHVESLLLLAKLIEEGISPFSECSDAVNAYFLLKIALYIAVNDEEKIKALLSLEFMLQDYPTQQLLELADRPEFNDRIELFNQEELMPADVLFQLEKHADFEHAMRVLTLRERDYLRYELSQLKRQDDNEDVARRNYEKLCERVKKLQDNDGIENDTINAKTFADSILANVSLSDMSKKNIVLVHLDALLVIDDDCKHICEKLINDLKAQRIHLIYLFAHMNLGNVVEKIENNKIFSCLDFIHALHRYYGIRVAEVITQNDKEKPGEWFRNVYCQYYYDYLSEKLDIDVNQYIDGYRNVIIEKKIKSATLCQAVEENITIDAQLLAFALDKIKAEYYQIIVVKNAYEEADFLINHNVNIVVTPSDINEIDQFDYISGQQQFLPFPFCDCRVERHAKSFINKTKQLSLKLKTFPSSLFKKETAENTIKSHVKKIIKLAGKSVHALLYLSDYARSGDEKSYIPYGIYKQPNITEAYFLLKLALLASGTDTLLRDMVYKKLISFEKKYWYRHEFDTRDFWHDVQLYENAPLAVLPKSFLYQNENNTSSIKSSMLRINGYSVFELFVIWENYLKYSYSKKKINCPDRNAQLSNLIYYYETMIGNNLFRLSLSEKDKPIMHLLFQHVDELISIRSEKIKTGRKNSLKVSEAVIQVMKDFYLLDKDQYSAPPNIGKSKDNKKMIEDNKHHIYRFMINEDNIKNRFLHYLDSESEKITAPNAELSLFSKAKEAEKNSTHGGKLSCDKLSEAYLLLIKIYLVSQRIQVATIAWKQIIDFEKRYEKVWPKVLHCIFLSSDFKKKQSFKDFIMLADSLYRLYNESEITTNNLKIQAERLGCFYRRLVAHFSGITEKTLLELSPHNIEALKKRYQFLANKYRLLCSGLYGKQCNMNLDKSNANSMIDESFNKHSEISTQSVDNHTIIITDINNFFEEISNQTFIEHINPKRSTQI